jgi:hypothetical protein
MSNKSSSTNHHSAYSRSARIISNDAISAYLGGSVILADYCPFMQQVSWSINNEIRDSKCLYEENKPDKNKNYILEEYGKSARCFLHNRSWQIYADKCQSRITVSKTIGCYNYKCDPKLGLLVKIHDKYIKCSHKDEVIEFTSNSNNKNSNFYFGNIVCPSCEEMCKDQIKCPSADDYISATIDDQQIKHDDIGEVNVVVPGKRHASSFQNSHKSSNNLHYLHNQHEFCLRQARNFASRIKLSFLLIFVVEICFNFVFLF